MRELIGILITYNGGAIYHRSKKLSTTTANTTEGESIATSRAGEIVEVARNALEAAGELQNHPTFVGTDNKPNMLIASMQGNASRVRHALLYAAGQSSNNAYRTGPAPSVTSQTHR